MQGSMNPRRFIFFHKKLVPCSILDTKGQFSLLISIVPYEAILKIDKLKKAKSYETWLQLEKGE